MKITVYHSDHCAACAQVVPVIQRAAQSKGVPVELVDVDKCGKPCANIRYVPTVLLDGHEVSLKALAEALRGSK